MSEKINEISIAAAENDIENNRANLFNVLWTNTVLVLIHAKKENNTIRIDKPVVDECSKLPIVLNHNGDDIELSMPGEIQRLNNCKSFESYHFSWPEYKNLNWFDIKKSLPEEFLCVLTVLFDESPAVVIRHKNKYFLTIPEKIMPTNQKFHLDVTKGVRYWCFLPNKGTFELRKMKRKK